MNLVLEYQQFIERPSDFTPSMISVQGKSSQAIRRHLGRIYGSRDGVLKRMFPRDPTAWSAAEDRDLHDQLQVLPQASCRRSPMIVPNNHPR